MVIDSIWRLLRLRRSGDRGAAFRRGRRRQTHGRFASPDELEPRLLLFVTTTVLTTSNAAPAYGDGVTLLASVSEAETGALPTGSVQFYVDGQAQGSPVTVTPADASTSAAQLSTTGLSAGAHAVSASYISDDTTFDNSQSNTISESVSQAVLTATAVSGSRVYGGTYTIPNPSYTLSGFKNTDNASNVTVTGAAVTTDTSNVANGVGTYVGALTLDVSALSSSNYTFTGAAGDLTITQASLSISANAQSSIYGSTPSLSQAAFTVTGLVNGDGLTTTPTLTLNGAVTSQAAAAAYTGAIGINGAAASSNYDSNITYTPGNWTITPAPLTITADSSHKTYGGTVTFAGTEFTTLGLVNSDSVTGVTLVSGGAAATAQVTSLPYAITASAASGTGLANYNITYQDGQLTVDQADLTIKANDQAKTYGDVVSFLGTEFTTTGLLNSDTVNSVTFASLGAASTANVPGSPYSITPSAASGVGLENYLISYASGSLAVGQAVLTVNAANAGRDYGYAALVTSLYSLSGFKNSETATTAGVAGLPEVTDTTFAATGVGSHGGAVVQTSVGTLTAANYSFTSGTLTADMTITPAPLTIAPQTQSSVYGTPPVVDQSKFDVSGLRNGDLSTAVVTAGPTLAVAGVDVHTHAGTVTGALTASGATVSSNYAVGYGTGDWTVTAAALTITPQVQSSEYGTTPVVDQTKFNVSGLVNGDVLTVNPTLAETGVSNLTHVSTLTGAISASGATASGDYTVGYATGDWSVSQAALTITPQAQSSVYGTTPAVDQTKFDVSGLVNGDVLTVNPTLAETGVSNLTHVGTYTGTISASGATASGDYTVGYATGDWSVSQAALTITPQAQSSVYGTTPAVDQTKFDVAGLVNGDTLTVNPTLAETGVSNLTHVSTSTGAISASGATASGDYTIGYATGDWSVSQAALTITPQAQASVYGTTPVVDQTKFNVAGLVNGDMLTVNPTLAETGVSNLTHVGTYTGTISASGATASSDYTIGYGIGDWSVSQAALTITPQAQSSVYGTSPVVDQTKFTVVGLVNGNTLATNPTLSATGITAGTDAGLYLNALTIGGAAASPDYSLAYSSVSWTVGKATVNVTAGDASRLYGQVNPLLPGYTISGFVNGQDASVVVGTASTATTATTASHVGQYAITVDTSTLSATNYYFHAVNGTLTIDKAYLFVNPTDATRLYGAADPVFGYGFSGFANGDNASAVSGTPTLGTNAVGTSPVGDYGITVADFGTLAALDYLFLKGPNAILSVTPAQVTLAGISPDTGTSASDGVTNTGSLVFSGTADPGSLVTVSDGLGVTIGTAQAATNRTWTIDRTAAPVPSGSYLLTATATDPGRHGSVSSASFSLTIDVTAPLAPAILSLSPDTGISASDGVTNTGGLVFTGTAEPGSIVTLSDSNLGTIGASQAASNGRWTISHVTPPLAAGSYVLTAAATDLAGNVSAASTQFNAIVDTTLPPAPVITSITRDASNLAVLKINVQGTAVPGATVLVAQQDVGIIGAVPVDSNGNWHLLVSNARPVNGLIAFTAQTVSVAGNGSPISPAATFRPNIVLINTDDQRWDEVAAFMPKTVNAVVNSGTLFTNAFSSSALCAPSRASLLTGQLPSDTGVLYNSPPLGGIVNFNDSDTLAVRLHNAGYRTSLVGKYETVLDNGTYVGRLTTPPGWDDFHAVVNTSDENGSYFNYTLVDNGVAHTYGSSAADYSTDVLSAKANGFVSTASQDLAHPFFLYFATPAPHTPYNPAPQYLNTLYNTPLNRPPSFNIPPSAAYPQMTADAIATMDRFRELHLEQMRSIDDAVGSMMTTLTSTGQLANTLLVYTSDNGLLWGEHAIQDKDRLYDEAAHVPLIIRDGRAPLQQTVSTLAAGYDIAPTLEAAANVALLPQTAGINLAPITEGHPFGRSDILIENITSDPVVPSLLQQRQYVLHTDRYVYVENQSSGPWLFDLSIDPYELTNRINDPGYASVVTQLAARLHAVAPAAASGPVLSNLQLAQSTAAGSPQAVTVSATMTDSEGRQVREGGFYVDDIKVFGTAPLDATDGRFDSTAENVSGRFSLAGMGVVGSHQLFAHARDAQGNWGPWKSSNFYIANPGVFKALTSLPGPGGGSQMESVVVSATGGQLLLAGNVSTGVPKSQVPNNPSAQLIINDTGDHITATLQGSDIYYTAGNTVGPQSVTISVLPNGGQSGSTTTIPIFVVAPTPQLTNRPAAFLYDLGSPAARIMPQANYSASDGAYANTSISMSLSPRGGTGISLDLISQGNGSGQVSVTGSQVSYSGQAVATYTPGAGWYTPLQLRFNASATQPAVQAVIRALAFKDSTTYFDFGVTNVVCQVTSGAGNSTQALSIPITFSKVDLLGGPPSPRYYVMSGPPLLLLPAAAPSGNDEIVQNAVLTLTMVNGGYNDRLNLPTTNTDPSQVVVNGSALSFGGVSIGSFTAGFGTTPLTFTLNSNASVSAVRSVLRNVQFSNLLSVPASYTRQTTISLLTATGSRFTVSGPDVIPVPLPTLNTVPGAIYHAGMTPAFVAPGLTLTDLGTTNYNAAKFTATITNGGYNDRISLGSQGVGPGQVSTSGSTVLYGGQSVATFTAGAYTTPLSVSFGANATLAQVQAVLRSIVFSNILAAPSAFRRTISVQATNGLGLTTPAAGLTVDINQAPVLGGLLTSAVSDFISLPGKSIYVPNTPDIPLMPLVAVSDAENDFANALVVVTPLGFGFNDRLTIHHQGNSSGQVGVSGTALNYGGVTVATFSSGLSTDPLRITFNGSASQAAVQAILRQVSFYNLAVAPSVFTRTVQVQITDGSGTVAAPFYWAVDVGAGSLQAASATATYHASGGALPIGADVTTTTTDAFAKGAVLQVALTAGGANDRVGLTGSGTGSSQLTATGGVLTYGGITVGSYAGGVGTSALVITLNNNASAAALQAIVHGLTFYNVTTSPTQFTRTWQAYFTASSGYRSNTLVKSISMVN